MRRNLAFYVLVLVVFGAGIALTLQWGSHLRQDPSVAVAPVKAAPAASTATASAPAKAPDGILGSLAANLKEPLPLLLLQVIVIAAAARLTGKLFHRFGQPRVIGEMLAGILLGPSLLGWVAPGASAFLFPAASLSGLKMLSQIGVILFMFVVGIELDIRHLRERADSAVLVSHASIVVPFFLGTLLALFLYPTLAPLGLPFSAFALFMGVSMSITAFPVLARILEERRLTHTHLGATAIACAAVDDVTAWCLLAVVVAVAKANGLVGAAVTILLSASFIFLMLKVVRPRFGWFLARQTHRGLGMGTLAMILIFLFTSALITEVIGIHALFGAFLAGVCIPSEGELRQFLRERLETFSSVLLLPLFFAFTGLRTQVGLLGDSAGWLLCLAVIAVATLGKLGGSMVAARWTGLSWLDSFSLGALMNTRGLVELIALNIGYDLGILSPRIFAMMVLMAVITTMMTGPLVGLVERLRARQEWPGASTLGSLS
jgi:Kef-type K+ transport system membrane component KefB